MTGVENTNQEIRLMQNRLSRLATAGSFLVLFVLQGCASMQAVESPNDQAVVAQRIKPGDYVRITLRGVEKYGMTVKTITPTHIVDDQSRAFALAEITELEVRTRANFKSVGLFSLLGWLMFLD
jgi:hypothetical protein